MTHRDKDPTLFLPPKWWRSPDAAGEETSELDAIRGPLLEAIRQALHERPDGAHMPQVGLLFRQLTEVPFEQFVNLRVLQYGAKIPNPKRKMLPFIQTYLGDLVEVNVATNGTATVSLRPNLTAASGEPAPPDRLIEMPVYLRSVWVAFVRRLADDHRRYLNLSSPIGFQDLPSSAAAPEGWIEIPRTEILGVGLNEEIDKPAVHRAIQAWSAREKVSTTAIRARVAPQQGGSRLDQLMTLIECLPPNVAADWQIPALVLLSLKD